MWWFKRCNLRFINNQYCLFKYICNNIICCSPIYYYLLSRSSWSRILFISCCYLCNRMRSWICCKPCWSSRCSCSNYSYCLFGLLNFCWSCNMYRNSCYCNYSFNMFTCYINSFLYFNQQLLLIMFITCSILLCNFIHINSCINL